MNHVFVDFENVHQVDFSLIRSKTVTLTLLIGARQIKVDTDLVEQLMTHASSVQLVRLTTQGKNALDFTLSYYLGCAVTADPTAYFHIVSKDKGFDPLVEHLRSRHINARRHNDFSTLTFSAPAKAPAAAPTGDLRTRVLEHLRKNTTNRPKSKKTLMSHLVAFAGKTATEADVLKLIESLRKEGHVTFGEKDTVSYQFGDAAS